MMVRLWLRRHGRRRNSTQRKHLNMIIYSLYVMRCEYGSQCKSIRAGQCDQSASSQKSNGQQNSTQTVAAEQETKANVQEHYYSNPTDYEPKHAPREVLIQQTRPSLIDGSIDTSVGRLRT